MSEKGWFKDGVLYNSPYAKKAKKRLAAGTIYGVSLVRHPTNK